MACCEGEPGYASPMDAMQGPREKTMYVVAINSLVYNPGKQDYLMTVDIDPESPTYGEVVHRLKFPCKEDELHHTGWNICSSCYGTGKGKRRFYIVPGFESSNIYIVDMADERNPKLHKTIKGEDVRAKANLSKPHTVHCLASEEIMISCLGDGKGEKKGGFLLLDAHTFEIKGTFEKDGGAADYNYDFWYQPRHNVMISTEWGNPNKYRNGFNPEDLARGDTFGQKLNIWDFKKREIIQKIDLGEDGLMSFEIRFFHNPDRPDGLVGCVWNGNMFHYTKKSKDSMEYVAKKVISLPKLKVKNWKFGDVMQGTIADLCISLDDKWVYFSNFLHGDIRQYNVEDPENPKLTGRVFVGGSICKDSGVVVEPHPELPDGQPERPCIKGRKLYGGPNMVMLSLDGKRLYTTNSLYSPWDAQFYPEMAEKHGSVMLQIDVDDVKGGLKINENFLADFGKEPDGPVAAHEMRYPGGDTTSDIWI